MRGIAPMQYRTQAPEGMDNAMGRGAMSKVTVNPQPQQKFMQETQGLQQNVVNNMSQQSVGAVQNLREGEAEESTKGYRAQEFLNRTLTNRLEDEGGGMSLMRLGAITQSQGKNQFLGDLAAGAQQAEALMNSRNVSSDLAQFRAEEGIELGAGGQSARGFGGGNHLDNMSQKYYS